MSSIHRFNQVITEQEDESKCSICSGITELRFGNKFEDENWVGLNTLEYIYCKKCNTYTFHNEELDDVGFS